VTPKVFDISSEDGASFRLKLAADSAASLRLNDLVDEVGDLLSR
jgi:hypothetical protein